MFWIGADFQLPPAALLAAKGDLIAGGEHSMQLNADPTIIAAAANTAEGFSNLGVNPATAAKDERAWSLWSRVCDYLGTAAVRTAQDVREHPGRITFLLLSICFIMRHHIWTG